VAHPHLAAYAARHGLGPDLPDLDALLVDWSPLLHDIRDRVPARWLALPLPLDTPRARSLRLLADPATPVADMAALVVATPDDPFLQHRLSRIARRAGDLTLAQTAAETALTLAPNDAARHAWAGLLALQSGDYDHGRTRIRTAMDHGLMLPGLAVLLSRAPGTEHDQTAPLINALAHAPGDPRLLVPLAEAQLRHANTTAAARTLDALDRAAPDHPRLPALRAALGQ
jgi:Flp pilus assembly protein TadD